MLGLWPDEQILVASPISVLGKFHPISVPAECLLFLLVVLTTKCHEEHEYERDSRKSHFRRFTTWPKLLASFATLKRNSLRRLLPAGSWFGIQVDFQVGVSRGHLAPPVSFAACDLDVKIPLSKPVKQEASLGVGRGSFHTKI